MSGAKKKEGKKHFFANVIFQYFVLKI